ncbi:uroporphyrinogen decarboxylase family protein [Caldicoprobacter faecalis]|uniref:Uroporphyrinogen decarboxylase n=1 Tax=Caldicoprobacter faecalis TaxID=937334 RepID=A0A1I5XZ25_9FIRM|nr:uroporphyrinogen decarboxylase family protein [Caldicoprobacter faecalis]SFQ37252.1 uroporphyrinogen decarboxylase [Caldicoprobacter faecalis]
MTPKERAEAALTLKVPDMVPTFELEFQLEEEMFGRKFITEDLTREGLAKLSWKEKEKRIYQLAEYMVEVYSTLEYSSIPGFVLGDATEFWNEGGPLPEETKLLIKYLRELVGDNYMIHYHGDGTFAIPDGNEMYEFAYAIADNREAVKEKAAKMAETAIKRNRRLAEAGVDCLILCSDYCYNSGPFLSPAMFEEFIQPYLYKIIDEARKLGLYTIKHTDGNIMPILDQLVECRPHALHSLDPQAGVDIKVVKELVGDKVCLCGNVNCALMQTGTDEEVIQSAEYALTYGKPGGGYIFCTSNVPFKGLPPERYKLILDVWRRMREY